MAVQPLIGLTVQLKMSDRGEVLQAAGGGLLPDSLALGGHGLEGLADIVVDVGPEFDTRALVNHWVLNTSHGLEHRALRKALPDDLVARGWVPLCTSATATNISARFQPDTGELWGAFKFDQNAFLSNKAPLRKVLLICFLNPLLM